ncbi:glutathione S-transferase [Pseudomonas benzenivorans]|uniref:Glutathione S-transferase n=1 Tax=Pseudomonas benzenivorans TaxID=556533 RepID=A0ABZ0Q0S0_9PSED|nr:glutathione S-transferase [Pseudomonas benzenivorans]WPC07068.1 glutathione S-transferase [Pseudomonas benzenivorans]
MQLIGMLDSPYVRRVAVSLQLLKLPFEHRPVSVFRHFEQFRQINPVVKAPSLVCADGSVLMDSTLILDYAESLADGGNSLMPSAPDKRLETLRVMGLALAACEKSVQVVYERNLRPADKQHAPWIDRITDQLLWAYATLETELKRTPLEVERHNINQAGVTAAVAWFFTQAMLPELVRASDFPTLQQLSNAAETLEAFAAAPHGPGTYQAKG